MQRIRFNMVFTPFHLGPALLLGMLMYRYLDFPTLLLASLVVDIRAFLVFTGVVDGPFHGVLHTYAGGTVLAFLLIGFITVVRPGAEDMMNRYLGISQVPTHGSVTGAAFVGIYMHIALDSLLYSEMNPFLPVQGNPVAGAVTPREAYLFSVGSFVTGLGLYWIYSSGVYHKISSTLQKYV